MLNTDVMLSAKTIFRFETPSNAEALSSLCRRLLLQQQETWQQLSEDYSSFASVQTRDIDCGTFHVQAQFNPHRIASTGADVTSHALRHRTCFLCVEHLPEPQKGILFQDTFLILCNPVPIFRQHFTVSSIAHVPQSFENNFESFLSLAKEISPDFSIFYNGPKCGASAPDHLHFQISPVNSIPVERDAVHCRTIVEQFHDVAVLTINDYGRLAIVIESANNDELRTWFFQLLRAWRAMANLSDEPNFNIIASYQNKAWRLIVFPRNKHRPDIFFQEERERIMISPAAVDMGGLLVTPREQDFLRVDAPLIKSIYNEVGMPESFLPKLLSRFHIV
ncbi:MAG TPA: DUF4922 domain-containing protein [Bacteroidota bacterium]|nr:DUF4922 domain-containing protein [Bacteroidota bacterium]